MRLFIFGIGYSARACIELLKKQCDWIAGTTRSAEKVAILKKDEINAYIYDGETKTSEISSTLRNSTHLLISIAPNQNGDCVIPNFSNDIINSSIKWIGYFSTVGVYGNHFGEWVNENSECYPTSNRSKWRILAESKWKDLSVRTNIPLGIMRLAGIYGPNRNAFVNLLKGTAKHIIKPDQVFNRIYVDDIAGTVAKSVDLSFNGILNVADGKPSPPQDVVKFAAELLGINPPKEELFDTANLSPMARSFYSENKRVSNEKLCTLLGYKLKFPNYRIALEHLYECNRYKK